MRIAGPGEVLGLSTTVVGRPCELTAETMEPSRIKLIPGESFRQRLRAHPELAFHVAQELAAEYNNTCHQLRSMLLSHTATQRLARTLLVENPVEYSALAAAMAWEKTYAAEAAARRRRNPLLYRVARAPKAVWQHLLRHDKLVRVPFSRPCELFHAPAPEVAGQRGRVPLGPIRPLRSLSHER